MNVTDRTFLISGGGSGLGAATARKLIEQGARVLIADIDEEKGRKLAGQLGERAHFALTDVVQAQSVQGQKGYEAKKAAEAIDAYGLDADKVDPWTV